MKYQLGTRIQALDSVNVRQTPGYIDKLEGDIFHILAPGEQVTVGFPLELWNDLVWMMVTLDDGRMGWAAETDAEGNDLFSDKLGLSLARPCDKQWVISQLYGENSQFYARWGFKGHPGIDFALPVGSNLYAMDDGVVDSVKFDAEGFGHYVKLIHSWGQSLYGHMSQPVVNPGQSVSKRQVIGLSGNTGISSGPHTHVQIRVNPFNAGDGMNGCVNFLKYLEE